jgi:hypothetical protein
MQGSDILRDPSREAGSAYMYGGCIRLTDGELILTNGIHICMYHLSSVHRGSDISSTPAIDPVLQRFTLPFKH